MRRKHPEVTKEGVLDTEGLDEDVQELFRYKDDGTVEVRRWINNVQWNALRALPRVCRDGEFEKEDMSSWTRKVIERNWQQVLADVEASNAHTKSIMWTSTCSQRHAVSENEGRGAVTFKNVLSALQVVPSRGLPVMGWCQL